MWQYDGLETGELAWVLGRKLLGTATEGATLADISQSAHALGLGYGPDRMQRLAYTSYMEAYFRAVHGKQHIKLADVKLSGSAQLLMSSELNSYSSFLGDASVLGAVDLPHVVNGDTSGQTATLKYQGANGATVDADPAKGLACGLLVVEKGPFLRGKIVNDDVVDMIAPGLKTPNGGNPIFHSVPRNMGDRLAFDALYAEMRQGSFFDWSPDGMVLSKLESPAGEPLSSAELDARQAQLFNVCIQGPAIAKTWSGDSKMQCMPLDRVFVVIVADISSATGGGGKDYAAAIDELFAAHAANSTATATDRVKTQERLAAARSAIDGFFGKLAADYDTAISGACKQGTLNISSSVMTNFRLMRVTSSYLAATSACVVDASGNVDPKSRCGLKLGQNAGTVTGEYIIGGWCIGSVIDSAASRSSIGNMVKTAPASMAININVNVEWWSGDDLYRRYMDVGGTVFQRGQQAKSPEAFAARAAGRDVSVADLEEALPWKDYVKA